MNTENVLFKSCIKTCSIGITDNYKSLKLIPDNNVPFSDETNRTDNNYDTWKTLMFSEIKSMEI
jgi:hypothetical protein